MSRNQEFGNGVRVAHWAGAADDYRSTPTPMGDVAHTTVTGENYNDRTSDVFAYGQCHALALAIHKKEGHPMGVVKDHSGTAVHYFNYDKNNPSMGFDAWGHSSVDRIVNRMAGVSHEPTNAADIRAEVKKSGGAWMKPNVAAAMTVTHHILGSGD